MFLAEMEHTPIFSETLTTMLSTFRKVTTSYWPGLFHCYDHADLPRTNNALVQYFGSARYHERRITGRKQASPSLVVRGAVRVVASALPACIPFLEQSFVPLISRNGELCGVNCIIVTRHGVCSIISAKLLKATS